MLLIFQPKKRAIFGDLHSIWLTFVINSFNQVSTWDIVFICNILPECPQVREFEEAQKLFFPRRTKFWKIDIITLFILPSRSMKIYYDTQIKYKWCTRVNHNSPLYLSPVGRISSTSPEPKFTDLVKWCKTLADLYVCPSVVQLYILEIFCIQTTHNTLCWTNISI